MHVKCIYIHPMFSHVSNSQTVVLCLQATRALEPQCRVRKHAPTPDAGGRAAAWRVARGEGNP